MNKSKIEAEQPEEYFPAEIYVTYDRSDGEVLCAFLNKEQCEREAKESGCGMQTVRLVWANDR